jgi:hypothetical protein
VIKDARIITGEDIVKTLVVLTAKMYQDKANVMKQTAIVYQDVQRAITPYNVTRTVVLTV